MATRTPLTLRLAENAKEFSAHGTALSSGRLLKTMFNRMNINHLPN